VATFCLIHGAWHGPSCWDDLIPQLQQRGHRALAPDLPLHDPAIGYEERIRPALEELEELDEEPVVVGHSQGTAYSALVAARRPTALLVHLCPRLGGFEEPAGAPRAFREGIPFPQTGPDGASSWSPDTAIAALYPRLPADAVVRLASRLRPMGMPDAGYPLDRHPDVPTALIYAADDELFEPDWERFMARELLGVEPIEISGGHFPMAEDPGVLGDLLSRLAPGQRRDGRSS
jgi:pimeloyl-ACP methyl ester carboxylesterase